MGRLTLGLSSFITHSTHYSGSASHKTKASLNSLHPQGFAVLVLIFFSGRFEEILLLTILGWLKEKPPFSIYNPCSPHISKYA